MIFCFFLFVLFLNDSAAVGELDDLSEFDLRPFLFKARDDQKMKFSCIYNINQTEFHVLEVSSTNDTLHTLSDKLDSRKRLSLFICGAGSNIDRKGYHYEMSKAWAAKSGRSICCVSYGYNKDQSTPANLIINLNNMVQENDIKFVAKMSVNFILDVRTRSLRNPGNDGVRDNSHVEIVAYSMGVPITKLVCLDLYLRFGKKVKFVLGLDPAELPIILDKKFHIRDSDADYVMCIHTSAFGTSLRIAHVDIEVYWVSRYLNPMEKHKLAVLIHGATSSQQLTLIAEQEGDGIISIGYNQTKSRIDQYLLSNLSKRKRDQTNSESSAEKTCLIGVYGSLVDKPNGQVFKMSFVNRQDQFNDHLILLNQALYNANP